MNQPGASLEVRLEQPGDITGVRGLLVAAFNGSGEADLVDVLRRAGGLILSAVALRHRRLVVHVAFSPVQ